MAQNQRQLDNLKRPWTKEEAAEIGYRGGKKSGETRRAKKTLKEELIALLETDKRQERMSIALVEKAMTGDTKAFEVIRDTIGEKPKDEVSLEMSRVSFTFDGIDSEDGGISG